MSVNLLDSSSDALCKIPLIIGVAGHRDLLERDISALEDSTRKIFAELRIKMPHTPFLIISSLAEGADRLFTGIALDEYKADLIVPLPFDSEEYLKDFKTDTSIMEFQSLLKRGRVLTTPMVYGNTMELIKKDTKCRSLQYAQAGAVIVDHCNVLVTFWNGIDNSTIGGTAHVVKFAIDGIEEPFSKSSGYLDAFQPKPIYHIATPRQITDDIGGVPYKIVFPYSNKPDDADKIRKTFDQTCSRINSYNHDIENLKPHVDAGFMKSQKDVISDEYNKQHGYLHERSMHILSSADILALIFRDRQTRALKMLFTAAVIAVLGFEIYAHLLKSAWVLAAYPIALLVAFGVYHFFHIRDNIQNKYLDYRALAEGLRVQQFWNIANVSEDVTDHYMKKQKNELNWIKYAIHTCNLIDNHDQDGNHSVPALKSKIEYVSNKWVSAQAIFYKERIAGKSKRLHKFEKTRDWLFGTGVVLSVLVVVGDLIFHFSDKFEHFNHWLVVIMGFLPAVAAALGGYIEKMAFSAETKRYEFANNIFNTAEVRLKRLIARNDLSGAQELIFELGKEALSENGDWLALHRDRPIEVPKGG